MHFLFLLNSDILFFFFIEIALAGRKRVHQTGPNSANGSLETYDENKYEESFIAAVRKLQQQQRSRSTMSSESDGRIDHIGKNGDDDALKFSCSSLTSLKPTEMKDLVDEDDQSPSGVAQQPITPAKPTSSISSSARPTALHPGSQGFKRGTQQKKSKTTSSQPKNRAAAVGSRMMPRFDDIDDNMMKQIDQNRNQHGSGNSSSNNNNSSQSNHGVNGNSVHHSTHHHPTTAQPVPNIQQIGEDFQNTAENGSDSGLQLLDFDSATFDVLASSVSSIELNNN
jgi:hypothetical protein